MRDQDPWFKEWQKVQRISAAINEAYLAAEVQKRAFDETKRKLGEALRDLRKKKGLSLRFVAKQLKVSAPYLSDMERGNRGLKAERYQAYLDLFVLRLD